MATEVEGILITHWHRDHIDGAFQLLQSCANARMYLSAALRSHEAFYLAALFKKDVFASTDKEIREFGQIIDFLVEGGDRTRIDTVSERHVFFDRKGDTATRLVALSPSGIAQMQAIANLVDDTPRKGSKRVRNVVRQTENLNAVALHFSFGDFAAVFGSDLEESGNSETGWSAVVRSGIADALSLQQANVFKVPHHGSKTGHHEEVWEKLLVSQPISMTTPYSRSGLPKETDVSRVSELSHMFWVTRDPRAKKRVKRDRMVEREMKAIAIVRRSINDKMGHVQIRVDGAGELDVATNGLPVVYRG